MTRKTKSFTIIKFVNEDLYDTLLKEIPFAEEVFEKFGKTMTPKRQNYSMGDKGKKLIYAGKHRPSNAYTETVLKLKKLVEKECGVEFNYILAQWYPDGEAQISAHGDNRKSLKSYCTMIVKISRGKSSILSKILKKSFSILLVIITFAITCMFLTSKIDIFVTLVIFRRFST